MIDMIVFNSNGNCLFWRVQLKCPPGRPPPTSAKPQPPLCSLLLPRPALHHPPPSPRPPPPQCCTPRQSWAQTPPSLPPPLRRPPPPSTRDHHPRRGTWMRSASTSAWLTPRDPTSQLQGQLPLLSEKNWPSAQSWRETRGESELKELFLLPGILLHNFSVNFIFSQLHWLWDLSVGIFHGMLFLTVTAVL